MKFSSFLPAGLLLLGAACPTVKAALRPFRPTTRMLHKQATNMTNGADLTINIADPPVNSTFQLAASESSMDLSIEGNASIGLGVPDVAYIYIIDTSGSTADLDGDCGTVLQCVQKFFLQLHMEAIEDGSAELAAVINFNDDAALAAGLQNPHNTSLIAAIFSGQSWYDNTTGATSGGTNCTSALEEAAKLVEDPSNTAGHTVVVFTGDGECNEGGDDYWSGDPTTAANALGATGAIVHSVAVGNDTDCEPGNYLKNITRNGGDCYSILDPDDLPDIIDHVIGTNLTSLELQVDDGNYTVINNGNISKALPQEGAISVDFDTQVELTEGRHEICVRATGKDSLGGTEQIEDCHEIFVLAQDEGAQAEHRLEGWKILLIVIFVLLVVSTLGVFAYRARAGSGCDAQAADTARGAQAAGATDLELQESGKREEGPSLNPIA